MTLKVFISYKSEYREFARAVKSELNEWGFDTWLDVDNIQPGDYFRHKIQQGLDSSDVLLMVLTEEAQLSREVMSEVDYFLDVAKKPVVPLLHRECKPLYIFVSIQYIDFIKDQANGFVHLKQKLNELASSVVKETSVIEDIIAAPPPKPITTASPDFFGTEVAIEGETAEQSQSIDFGGLVLIPESKPDEDKDGEAKPEAITREESQKKEAVLDDGLAGSAPLEPASGAAVPKPQPAPPPPPMSEQQAPAGFPAAAPAANAPVQPTRQQPEYMPQPAALGRKKSRPIFLPLAAVASLIVVVGAVVLVSSLNATLINTSQEPQGTSPLVWVGLAGVLGVIGFFGWRWLAHPKASTMPNTAPIEDAQNRATMLQKVEDFWLKGVLDPALEAGSLDINLSAAPGAVLRHKDYGDYALPPNANILDVFNDLNRELLILGAPGGGKTVLLLQLARELIKQARQDSTKAIPVVFNLSSWAAERKPLADWLVDELRQKYQVPKKVSATWVEGEKLLLLLDGLDEVAEQYRNECVDAINSFRQKYRTVDLAICSRAVDYDALTSRLDVRGAIVLEPLSQQKIADYLNRPELANLRQVMTTDMELQEMSEVPFLLNAMAYAYAGATGINLQFAASDSPAKARRTHLFDRWVEKRMGTKPSTEYTPSKVRNWLRWLSGKLLDINNNAFYIEDLDAEKLNKKSDRILYLLGKVAGIFLLCGLNILVAFLVAPLLHFSLPQWYLIKYVFLPSFITFTILILIPTRLIETLKWSFRGALVTLVLLIVFLVAPIYILWKKFFKNEYQDRLPIKWFILVYIFPLIFCISVYYIISRYAGPIIGILIGIPAGLILFLAFFTISGGMFGGIEYKSELNRRSPNSGILTTSRIAFITGVLFYGILIIITIANSHSDINLRSRILDWWVFPLLIAIGLGGSTIFKHLIIRFILWYRGNAPWNYARFLDYCVSAGLMRKVGGGYIFAHRYLMEYFAESGNSE